MRSGRVFAWLAVATLAVLSAGCDKGGSAAADAGDAAARPESGADASAASDAGALDDVAMPASSGPDLETRMRHLVEALAQNDPDLASDVLFPREGYIAARDAPDPAKLWERKVSGLFRRSIEKTHKRTKGIEHAKFVSFELGKSVAQLTPKKKDFKKPLWRVKHSKLVFSTEGKTHHLTVAEMTAWRGAWYVTRLK